MLAVRHAPQDEILAGGRSSIAFPILRLKMRYLQVDHRVPFPISGDINDKEPSNFMLLCGSCNRSKSWSCEHCPNWKNKDADVCKTCYWANPESHTHVATVNTRRLDVTWQGDEVPHTPRLSAL